MTSPEQPGEQSLHASDAATGGDGRVRARLLFNLAAAMGGQLDDSRFGAYLCHLPVVVAGTTVSPDLVVARGAAESGGLEPGSPLAPVLIVDVLPGPGASMGSGEPSRLYEQIPSLREYLLVASDRSRVEHRLRSRQGGWRQQLWEEPCSYVPLDSVGCILPLRDVYRGVLG